VDKVETSPMTSHPPPVPPEQRPPFQSDAVQKKPDENQAKRDTRREQNLAEQGRQGNMKQHTTKQGYQQDR
jgi:hypothetical protein